MSAIEIETNDYTNVPSGQTINFSNTYRCDSAIHERILVRREGERHVICRATYVLALLLVAFLASACSPKRTAIPPPPAPDRTGNFIDLHADWRIEVVTPLGKSGDYRLRFAEGSSSGNTVSLRADDFQGYEKANYRIDGREHTVRIQFVGAEHFRDGKSTPQTRSVLPLFQPVASRSSRVRLVFLRRVSALDHNMAVIVARSVADLEAATQRLQESETGCSSDPRCSWIPAGVAVRVLPP